MLARSGFLLATMTMWTAACGGSSSETPPPPPLRLAVPAVEQPSVVQPQPADAGTEASAEEEDEAAE